MLEFYQMMNQNGILVIIIIVLLLFNLIFNYISRKQSESVCKDQYCQRVAVRDFVYCIIIAVMLIIALSTALFSSNEEMIRYVSFASTISSMILSVLAIFMSVYGESKLSGLRNAISNSAAELKNTAKELSDLKCAIDNTKINTNEITKMISNFENSMQKKIAELGEIVKQADNENISSYKKIRSSCAKEKDSDVINGDYIDENEYKKG